MSMIPSFVSRTIRLISLLHLLSVLSLVLLKSLSDAQPQPEFLYRICGNLSSNTRVSISYIMNLSNLLNQTLYNKSGNSLYDKAAEGDYPDKVYGLFHCRFDVSHPVCQNCVSVAISNITKTCDATKEAIVWYDKCLVRFSNRSFASTMETFPMIYMWNMGNITEREKFNEILDQSFSDLIRNATSESNEYAAQTVNISFATLYTLVQCIPDLSKSDCSVCLRDAVAQIPSCCAGKRGGRVLLPSCNIRFELYPFLESPTQEDSVPVSPPNKSTGGASDDSGKKKKKENRTWIVIGTAASAIIVILLSSSFIFLLRRRKKMLVGKEQ